MLTFCLINNRKYKIMNISGVLEGGLMSFYSIGKNEVRLLLAKEHQLKNQLQKDKGVVSSFQAVIMEKELKKIHTKLKVLGYAPNDDNVA